MSTPRSVVGGDDNARLSFVVDYFDPQAALVRKYQLNFYPNDNTLEMFDLKNKRVFLKRCPYQQLTTKQLFIGATVTIFGRTLAIAEYGDEVTRRQCSQASERAILVFGGDALYNVGNILKAVMSDDVRIFNIRMCKFSDADVKALGTTFRTCCVVEVVGSGLEQRVVHWTSTFPVEGFVEPSSVSRWRTYAFESPANTATGSNCAVLVIKPHAVASNAAGAILQRILDDGFEMTALATFHLSPADAADFLEIYNGVVPEYKKLVDQMCSGLCWAIELRAENAVEALRATCGPHDPEICRALYPNSIRALWGTDRVLNAVHCTDLPEDGPLESEFFFQLLSAKP